MSENKETSNLELFFPYYINQGRLLDIYAILNGGYSEYEEITTAISDEKTKGGKIEATVSGGFKLFNFGGSVSGNAEKTDLVTSENKEKKVQTVTSVLSIVKHTLANKGYLNDIEDAASGQFVLLPVSLSINSIKSLITEMSDLLKLATNMQKIGASVKGAGNCNKDIENILKAMQVLFAGEEVLFETDKYAIVGNIVDSMNISLKLNIETARVGQFIRTR